MENFYVIVQNDYDLVLGVTWLKKVGPLEWDFSILLLEFHWNSNKVLIIGIKLEVTSLIFYNRLFKAYKEGSPIAIVHICQDIKEI